MKLSAVSSTKCAGEIREPRLGGAGECPGLIAPGETHGAGVQGVIFKNETGALLPGQAVLDQREIQILVTTIDFVAHDRMAEVREVDADLMFAAGARPDAEEGERG